MRLGYGLNFVERTSRLASPLLKGRPYQLFVPDFHVRLWSHTHSQLYRRPLHHKRRGEEFPELVARCLCTFLPLPYVSRRVTDDWVSVAEPNSLK
jgi:hypothetical protein